MSVTASWLISYETSFAQVCSCQLLMLKSLILGKLIKKLLGTARIRNCI